MAFRLVDEAEADLLNIWINLALDIGNEPAADHLIDAINERFFFLVSFLTSAVAETICDQV